MPFGTVCRIAGSIGLIFLQHQINKFLCIHGENSSLPVLRIKQKQEASSSRRQFLNTTAEREATRKENSNTAKPVGLLGNLHTKTHNITSR